MKITKIEVKNFRSLQDVNITGTLPVNMIFGVNNSGKSNIFKFIELVFRQKERQTTVEYQDENGRKKHRKSSELLSFYDGNIYDEPFLIFKNDRSSEVSFTTVVEVTDDFFDAAEISLLSSIDVKYKSPNTKFKFNGKITTSGDNEYRFLINEILVNEEKFLQRDSFDRFEMGKGKYSSQLVPATNLIEKFNNIAKLIPTDRSLNDSEPFGIRPSKSTLSSKNIRNFLFDKYINSDTNHEFVSFIEFLNASVPSKALLGKFQPELSNFPMGKIDITFSRFSENIDLMISTPSGKYPILNYGTGTQQLLYILAYIYFEKPKVLLLEEIELNLSIIYQHVLIYILKTKIEEGALKQLFFTSHSDQFRRNDFRHFHVTQNDGGATQINNIENPRTFFEKLSSNAQSE